MGNFTIELNAERAPLTVANILAYVDSGHYTNTLIHRVVADFVIQGGGFNADYTAKAAPLRVNNESGNGLSNVRGTVGLARGHGSAWRQLSVLCESQRQRRARSQCHPLGLRGLRPRDHGMDVVDRIGNVATGKHGAIDETPIKPVVILKIERVTEPERRQRSETLDRLPE